MTVQGIGRQQQLQSSPHQQACLMGILGPLEEEELVEVVDGGILVVAVVVEVFISRAEDLVVGFVRSADLGVRSDDAKAEGFGEVYSVYLYVMHVYRESRGTAQPSLFQVGAYVTRMAQTGPWKLLTCNRRGCATKPH